VNSTELTEDSKIRVVPHRLKFKHKKNQIFLGVTTHTKRKRKQCPKCEREIRNNEKETEKSL